MSEVHLAGLSPTEETLLVPLFCRAAESRRKHAILRDPKAIEMVAAIPWDYQRFNQRWRRMGVAVRAAMFDEWVRAFVQRHPEGTLVEIGAGLSTRFERLDNGTVHWFDLDLPEVIELRRRFFRDGGRYAMLAASVTDTGWMETVRRSPPPYFFVAETVLIYLQEQEVRGAMSQIAEHFPDSTFALDTASHKAVAGGNRDFVRRKLDVQFRWACDHPRDVEDWHAGWRLVESRGLTEIRETLRSRLSMPMRAGFFLVNKLVPAMSRAYQLNLYRSV